MALAQWMEQAERELGFDPSHLGKEHPYGFLKALYTNSDLPDWPLELPGVAGSPRGPYATMYSNKKRPWTQRQYAGFGDARDTNLLYRSMYEQGARGLSVAFDLPTHLGYDSDDPFVKSEVGMSGVALDSAIDYATLFDGMPLNEVSVSMTMNGAVLQTLASLVLVARAQGVDPKVLRGTLQNDPLKELAARNTEIFGMEASMRITRDIIAYCAKEMPKFNPISISGYHYQEAGADIHQELAFMLAGGIEYVRTMKESGMEVDEFAPQLSFFYSIGIDFWGEVAKMRAGRVLWNQYALAEGATTNAARTFKFHSHTSGVSLQAQDPQLNIVRAAYEALAAVLGGTQSMHISSFDEAVGLPSAQALRISTGTHYILREESGVANVIDPMGGSYFMEAATSLMAGAADKIVQQILEMGGMRKAVESGFIEEQIAIAASTRQAGIDKGNIPIIGVNTFVGETPPLEPQRVNAGNVLTSQRDALEYVRSLQDPKVLGETLSRLGEAARSDENLMPFVIDAMGRGCATWGDITKCLQLEFGIRQRVATTAPGIYANGMTDDPKFNDTQTRSRTAAQARGDKPLKMLLVTPGLDGHDRGPNVVAAGFRDLGFDVEWGGVISMTARDVAQHIAESNSFDVIGISSHGGAHVAYVDELSTHLREFGVDGSALIVLGGVVPIEDYDLVCDAGVSVIIQQGTVLADSANQIMDALGIPAIVDSHSSIHI